MSPVIRQVLGESAEPLPVIETTRAVKVLQCPHCQQEIHEKHVYVQEGVDYHSDCRKPIRMPAPDPASIPDWLKPYMPKR